MSRYINRYLRVNVEIVPVPNPGASWQSMQTANQSIITSEILKEILTFTEEFKIVFDIASITSESTLLNTQTAQIEIYNLDAETQKKLAQRGSRINVVAGYQDLYDVLFVGEINNVKKSKRGPDIITTLYCATNISEKIFETVNGGVRITNYLKSLCARLNIPCDIPDNNWKFTPSSGFSYSGSLSGLIGKICKDYAFIAAWINRKLVMLDKNSETEKRKEEIFVFNMDTGLIDIPEISDAGAVITTFLNPKVQLNKYVKIEAEYANFNIGEMLYQKNRLRGNTFNAFTSIDLDRLHGTYYVRSARYSGDTRGDDWFSIFTCQIHDNDGRVVNQGGSIPL